MGDRYGGGQARPLRERVAEVAEFVQRRLAGEYMIDEFGFDPDLNASVLMPIARVLYRDWFRVKMRGLENVPGSDAALLVANHAGVLPFDMIMVQAGLFYEHPQHRNLRLLGADLVYELPILAQLARKSGHTLACPPEAAKLLAAGELVGVCPEGFKGTGKPFSERYKLRRFGRGGFAVSAISAGVPIIPCAIVGAEEIYPMIGNARGLARLLGLPYFPLTPLFPWFGFLGMIPLPSDWIIQFGEPIPTDNYSDPDDTRAVAELATQVRDTVQQMLNTLVAERGPAFSY
ncbi:MAG TPA: lysophospholipid acyltransferase family protein [Streptosporangiaceae bacterium]|jgi:1-acyl-sn-glycerol-3-phosphate acyltransferase|nr:lysophospholipid acyltransferase family protein [Streptosporangiaceae bacterium]